MGIANESRRAGKRKASVPVMAGVEAGIAKAEAEEEACPAVYRDNAEG